jgi:exodeoxyribonuclease VII large subunit
LAERDINFIEKTVTTNDPRRLMKTGYSLSFINGKLARNLKDITKGDTVTTQLADGQFTSEVKEVK